MNVFTYFGVDDILEIRNSVKFKDFFLPLFRGDVDLIFSAQDVWQLTIIGYHVDDSTGGKSANTLSTETGTFVRSTMVF